MTGKSVTSSCIVLFSGGLDSILACNVLEDQGVRVTGLKFITPFFGYDIKGREEEYKAGIHEKYGVRLKVADISRQFVSMLKNPAHGYGKHFNPCIDCKILMLDEAFLRLKDYKADFIATGEVLGQRPFSQRRDALSIIEKKSRAKGLILRPLSALKLRPTSMEENGMVDRSMLFAIHGRGRKPHLTMAEKYNIRDFPSPSGGCILADANLSKRFRNLFRLWPEPDVMDCRLCAMGRIFLLPDRSLLILGRNEEENKKLISMAEDRDVLLLTDKVPGPVALWRRLNDSSLKKLAASVVCFFVKKNIDSQSQAFDVKIEGRLEERLRNIEPISQKEIEGFDFTANTV